ncbi:MAG: chromosomal replication initiator protein DnaA [Deltaproteobacteria bacterium]
MNNKYTFERFVVGSSNQFAHAASIAVAKQPAKSYNPLFIYSGFGLGKTHLLHAIGLLTASAHPEFNIQYVSGEEFMNEMINSIRYDLMPKFRGKYRNIDLLLIDDIHIWAGKERTQEEFFHVFNILHDSGKQIVIASDKFTKDISNLEGRLRARFEWGLIVDIQPPEIETRIAIIKNQIQENNISISDNLSYYIALHVKSNIGELKGFLGLVNSYSSLTGREINLDLVKEVLKIAKFDKTRLPRFHSRMFSVIRRKRLRKER